MDMDKNPQGSRELHNLAEISAKYTHSIVQFFQRITLSLY